MGQLVEFVGNHTLLFVALFAVLGMIVYTEWTRFQGAGSALSPFAATRLLNDDEAVLIDVRNESEYKTGHVLNARSIPLSDFDKRLHELQKFKDRDVVVYCDNGMRTSRALGKLKKAGFSRLHTINGGLVAWEKASLPTVTR